MGSILGTEWSRPVGNLFNEAEVCVVTPVLDSTLIILRGGIEVGHDDVPNTHAQLSMYRLLHIVRFIHLKSAVDNIHALR